MKKEIYTKIQFLTITSLCCLSFVFLSCNKVSDNEQTSIPIHSILADDSYETTGKAQVLQSYLVEEENLTKESLKILLEQLYAKALKTKGWNNHSAPTVIGIRLYTSRQHFLSRSWIGEVSKLGFPDSEPNYKIHEGQLENLRKPGEVRWALTEKKRKEIYALLDEADKKASKKADLDMNSIIKATDNYERFEILYNSYKKEIYTKHRLTEEQVSKIELEGFYKNWSELHSYINASESKGVRWGLTEKKRMEILALFGQAHIEALNEADAKYSDFGKKHGEMTDSLTKTHSREISRKYKLSKEQVSKLYREANIKNWPKFYHPKKWPKFHKVVYGGVSI